MPVRQARSLPWLRGAVACARYKAGLFQRCAAEPRPRRSPPAPSSPSGSPASPRRSSSDAAPPVQALRHHRDRSYEARLTARCPCSCLLKGRELSYSGAGNKVTFRRRLRMEPRCDRAATRACRHQPGATGLRPRRVLGRTRTDDAELVGLSRRTAGRRQDSAPHLPNGPARGLNFARRAGGLRIASVFRNTSASWERNHLFNGVNACHLPLLSDDNV